jgi:hypothetical protein
MTQVVLDSAHAVLLAYLPTSRGAITPFEVEKNWSTIAFLQSGSGSIDRMPNLTCTLHTDWLSANSCPREWTLLVRLLTP